MWGVSVTDQETIKIRSTIEGTNLANGQARVRCPVCSDDRRKSNERTMSLTVDNRFVLYKCHHCEVGGSYAWPNGKSHKLPCLPDRGAESLKLNRADNSAQTEDISINNLPLSEKQIEWFKGRGIGQETLLKCGVVSGNIFVRHRGSKVSCIGFPYVNKDGTKATKWRDGGGNWTQTGAARSLLRIDEFDGGDLVITEGEMDMLSLEEIGVSCTSAPNGAPSGPVKSLSAKKFSYLWDAKEKIDSADRVILATDSDVPGMALSEEIARRIGKARCWIVEYPEDCKDANEVLVIHGRDRLIRCIAEATPWPVAGLRDVNEYRNDVLSLFKSGFDIGVSSGVESLDNVYKVTPQTLTVVTGIPGSGKSTFLTWLSVQIASREGWNCAVLSAETSSQIHILQLSSVLTGKPFRGPNKMTLEELNTAIDWVSERFVFLDESDTDIDSILERAQAAVLRNGIRLLVIDPYNFLTVNSSDDSGLAGINRLLVSLKSFAVEHGIAIWLVAHPVKMYAGHDGKTQTPTGVHVAGSSSFFNVCDAGLSLVRTSDGESTVSVWKARFPWIGKLSDVVMDFDLDSG